MIGRIKRDVELFLSQNRYEHTLGVVRESRALSELYGESSDKAEIASLLHDIGKSKEIDELLKVKDDFDIILKENLKKNNALYHAAASKKIAICKYGIDDNDILNAIRYHTTGRANMSKLEKIVYIADCTESGRSFDGVEKLRALSREDLDKALLFALDNTVKHVISKGLILHEYTVRARNYTIAQSEKVGVKK